MDLAFRVGGDEAVGLNAPPAPPADAGGYPPPPTPPKGAPRKEVAASNSISRIRELIEKDNPNVDPEEFWHASYFANKLGLTTRTAQRALQELVETGELVAFRLPGHMGNFYRRG